MEKHSGWWISLLFFSALLLKINETIGGINPDTQYTPEEKEGLENLKRAVAGIIYKDYHSLDSYLIHYLRKRKLNVNETVQLVKENFNWRKANGIDSILEDKEMIKMETQLPFDDDSVDKEGRPTLVVSIQKLNLRILTISGKADMIMRYQSYVREKLLHNLYTLALAGKDVSQINILINLAGFNQRQHICTSCAQQNAIESSKMLASYYPFLVHEVTVINAPRAFTTFLAQHKNLFNLESVARAFIYGFDKSEWREHLRERFEDDQLISEFGGTRVNLEKMDGGGNIGEKVKIQV